MKAKEKARELVDKFQELKEMDRIGNTDPWHLMNKTEAKQCAIICLEQILNHTPLTIYPDTYIEKNGTPPGSRNWWQEVKQEIEKL